MPDRGARICSSSRQSSGAGVIPSSSPIEPSVAIECPQRIGVTARPGTGIASGARRSAHATDAACGALPASRSARVARPRRNSASACSSSASSRSSSSREISSCANSSCWNSSIGAAAPQGERVSDALRRLRRVVLDQSAGVGHAGLESDEVDRVGVDLQHVAVVARLQHVALDGGRRAPVRGPISSARSRPTGRSPYRLRRRPTALRGSGRWSPPDWHGAPAGTAMLAACVGRDRPGGRRRRPRSARVAETPRPVPRSRNRPPSRKQITLTLQRPFRPCGARDR